MEPEGTVTTHGRAPSFIIKRPRLTKLLDESEARIILLVAPAGYGKTTLAREWLSERRGVTVWYSASAASADVVALAMGLAEELDSAIGDSRDTCRARLSRLTAVQQRPDVLARVLANAPEAWPSDLKDRLRRSDRTRNHRAQDDRRRGARSSDALATTSCRCRGLPPRRRLAGSSWTRRTRETRRLSKHAPVQAL
jgi:hypothetical protein